VSQDSLWPWRGDSSGIQEGERLALESVTRGLVKGQQTGKAQSVCVFCVCVCVCVCSELQTV
jgi:hypothetical protein